MNWHSRFEYTGDNSLSKTQRQPPHDFNTMKAAASKL